MYKLNNIPLSNFGIVPSHIKGSNIALTGWLDMPKRIGKTYHIWKDRQGVEPYVEKDDIYFGGRDLLFRGYIEFDNEVQLNNLLNNFYSYLKGFKNLIEFSTPYGYFNVTLQKEIKTEVLQHKFCYVDITFREPEVSKPFNYFQQGYFSTGYFDAPINPMIIENLYKDYESYGIDGIPFHLFNAILIQPEKTFNRAKIQQQAKLKSDTKEDYEITAAGAEKIKLDLLFIGNSIEELSKNTRAFQMLLSREKQRALQIDNRLTQAFCVDGYKVKNINISNQQCTSELSVQLIKATNKLFEPGYFQTGYFF